MKKLFVILGNHLFDLKFFPKGISKDSHVIFMAEDEELCTHFKYHKHKIILFLAAMRNYRDELREKGFTVEYCELGGEYKGLDYTQKLEKILAKTKIKEIDTFEIEDKFFEKKLLNFFQNQYSFNIYDNPSFLTTRQQFREYLDDVKKPFMASFYQRQRIRLGILLTDSQKPVGGQWSYDQANRKKLPKKVDVPEIELQKNHDQNTRDIISLVNEYFSDHIGVAEDFWIPVNRKDALKWLDTFLEQRFEHFGTYQDAIDQRTPFLFHSLLSPMINLGLLHPREVVDKILESYQKGEAGLNSVEGIIRQIIGWREFVRGIYQNFSEREDSENFFGHTKDLGEVWYTGELGIEPVDDAIKKVREYGFAHHIERLMILSNFMLLCERDPRQVHKWFMELFVDSSDWVMGPNVYGMGQFSDGGIFATKPYISGSNYIKKMSHYKSGSWCDIWDGLYWRFIEKNKNFYASNPRMGFVISTLEKMDKERKKTIFNAAEKFLESL